MTVSDPAGNATFEIERAALTRYQFETRTGTTLLCTRCGMYAGVILEDGGRMWSVINVRGLAFPEFKGRTAEPVVYEGETAEARIARRKQKWTPTELKYHRVTRPDMPTEILMPALSPTMEEGKLAKWLVKEGQTVKAGDIIAEIETDKATMEVEAVDEGKVGKLLVSEGTEGVKVNTPIATLLADGESAGAAPAAKASTPPAPKAETRSPPSAGGEERLQPPRDPPHISRPPQGGRGPRRRRPPRQHFKRRRPRMAMRASSPRRWRGGWRSRRGSI